ncbi:MAG: glutamate-5-semialdehyde dehydrogenase [Deltaproteobacteria bacterium]|nr:glutamate-5-semialdehyde dehydrogenase [Deltaproteobacteria bacterium]
MSPTELVTELTRRAKAASERVAELASDPKDAALRLAADRLEASSAAIVRENARDLEAGRARGLDAAMLDRLALDAGRIAAIANGLREVAALPDPVGEVTRMWNRPSGLQVGRMRIPLGVILVIYESRPNVTADVAALCLKSGNATILRGGSEAIHSNRALAGVLRGAFAEAGVPEDALQLVPTTEREIVDALLEREGEIDLVIPRGGESLIRRVAEKSRIPVIKHYNGICHVYLDEFAEPKMAREIALNSKCQRVSVCNAAETLLIHAKLAKTVLPDVLGALAAHGVELRACERTRAEFPSARAASEQDYRTEWLARTMSVRMVDSLDQAIDHIRRYGSNHTETIVTQDVTRARAFLRRVNSSSVFVNASTRFADGFQLGLGAEVGVSTTKMHWYGPMGLEGLTTQKFIAYGEGTILE